MMKYKALINKTYLNLLLLFVSLGVFAQSIEDVARYKSNFPDEKYLQLNSQEEIVIDLDDGEFIITYRQLEEDIYLTNDAKSNSKESRTFSHFFTLEEIEATAWNIEGNRYKKTEVENFKFKDRLDQSFYDDSKSINFIYSNLSEGSRTELDYTVKIKDPRFLPTFFFGDSYPVLAKKCTIKVDADIDMGFIDFYLDQTSVSFTEENNRRYNIYTWTASNLPSIEFESGAPSFKRFIPHVIPVIKSYQENDEPKVNVLNDVSGLYSWYSRLVLDVNSGPVDPALKELTLLLIKDKKTDLEKVEAIYYWVQENIKYIDFEYALGGFVPREANDVFSKKYGDCKDNSSILKVMLEVAGLQGELTWLGTRDIPYKYNEVPTPSVDNHMILTYLDGDQRYYLDATGRYHPINLPTSFIQGKEVLIQQGKDDFIIDKVPVVPALKNKFVDSVSVDLEDSNLIGSGVANYSGYRKIDLLNNLERANKDKLDEFFKYQLLKGDNRFALDSITQKEGEHYADPYLVDYTFHIDQYAQVLGDEIYLNLNLEPLLEGWRIDKDRKLPVEYDYKSSFELVNTLNIPDGYEVEYIPENFSIANPLIDASINYSVEDNKVIYKHKVTLNFIELSKEQQNTLNNYVDQTSSQYRELIILKKVQQ